jgi:hypothetical protein
VCIALDVMSVAAGRGLSSYLLLLPPLLLLLLLLLLLQVCQACAIQHTLRNPA